MCACLTFVSTYGSVLHKCALYPDAIRKTYTFPLAKFTWALATVSLHDLYHATKKGNAQLQFYIIFLLSALLTCIKQQPNKAFGITRFEEHCLYTNNK